MAVCVEMTWANFTNSIGIYIIQSNVDVLCFVGI